MSRRERNALERCGVFRADENLFEADTTSMLLFKRRKLLEFRCNVLTIGNRNEFNLSPIVLGQAFGIRRQRAELNGWDRVAKGRQGKQNFFRIHHLNIVGRLLWLGTGTK